MPKRPYLSKAIRSVRLGVNKAELILNDGVVQQGTRTNKIPSLSINIGLANSKTLSRYLTIG